MIRRLVALAAAAAIPLAFAPPAGALTGGAACADGADWDWTVSIPPAMAPVRTQIVIGLSEAVRTITIHAPAGCSFDTGDSWQVFSGSGGFSASGFITSGRTATRPTLTRSTSRSPTRTVSPETTWASGCA